MPKILLLPSSHKTKKINLKYSENKIVNSEPISILLSEVISLPVCFQKKLTCISGNSYAIISIAKINI